VYAHRVKSRLFSSLLFVSTAFAAAPTAAEGIDYQKTVLPIMKEHRWECHSNEKPVKGNFALDPETLERGLQFCPSNAWAGSPCHFSLPHNPPNRRCRL
jgi:hypothetical protein